VASFQSPGWLVKRKAVHAGNTPFMKTSFPSSTMVGPTSYTCKVMEMKNMVSQIINHPQGGINHYIKMGDFLKAGS